MALGVAARGNQLLDLAGRGTDRVGTALTTTAALERAGAAKRRP